MKLKPSETTNLIEIKESFSEIITIFLDELFINEDTSVSSKAIAAKSLLLNFSTCSLKDCSYPTSRNFEEYKNDNISTLLKEYNDIEDEEFVTRFFNILFKSDYSGLFLKFLKEVSFEREDIPLNTLKELEEIIEEDFSNYSKTVSKTIEEDYLNSFTTPLQKNEKNILENIFSVLDGMQAEILSLRNEVDKQDSKISKLEQALRRDWRN